MASNRGGFEPCGRGIQMYCNGNIAYFAQFTSPDQGAHFDIFFV